MSRTLPRLLPSILAVVLAGCAPGPRPVRLGEDVCANCLMTAADPSLVAELVTAEGKVYTFDSVECLAAYVLRRPDLRRGATLWVADVSAPARPMLRAESARYVHSDGLRTPMAMNVAAFAPSDSIAVLARFPGELLSWTQVLERSSASPSLNAAGHREPREEEYVGR